MNTTPTPAQILAGKVAIAIRLADDVGRSRGTNVYARNERAVRKLVDLEAEIDADISALAQPALAAPVLAPSEAALEFPTAELLRIGQMADTAVGSGSRDQSNILSSIADEVAKLLAKETDVPAPAQVMQPVEASPSLTLPIQAGKKYVQRDGDVVRIDKPSINAQGVHVAHRYAGGFVGSTVYASTGRAYPSTYNGRKDIVADYIEVQQAAPVAPTEPNKIIALAEKCSAEVGRYEGKVAWVKFHSQSSIESFATGIVMSATLKPRTAAKPEPVVQQFLTEDDFADLFRFIETSEDGEGYDIGKESVQRLASLGVVQNLNFGKYGTTEFGYFVQETVFLQNPSLPLLLDSDRDHAQRDRLAVIKGTP